MTQEQRADKVIIDDFFEILVGNKVVKYQLPTMYYKYRISKIASSIDIDLTQLDDTTNDNNIKYALGLNFVNASKMCSILAIILYGRNKYYKLGVLGSVLNNMYLRKKKRHLMRTLTNEHILDIFHQYIMHSNLGNFIEAMRYIETMRASKPL